MRTFIAGSALAVAVAALACATDEAPSLEPTDHPSPLPGADASPVDGDASDVEDAGAADPCLPGSLCPSGPFEPSTVGGPLDLRTRIRVIRGRSASDVWAVGARGAAAHFDGTSWSRAQTGAVESLSALWLLDAGELAMVSPPIAYSHGADLIPADGATPSPAGWIRTTEPILPAAIVQGTIRPITSLFAPADAEWAWGTIIEGTSASSPSQKNGLWRARVVEGDGGRNVEFAVVLPPGACAALGCVQLQDIHGSSADDLWAVGVKGATFHITGAQSETPTVRGLNSRTWAGLNGVWAASPTDVWAVGGAGTIRHYTGGDVAWDVIEDVPTTEDLHAVWGTSKADVWAVGDHATVLHYDGATWSLVDVRGLGDRAPDLFTVWTSAPGHVWVGGDGVILSLGGKP